MTTESKRELVPVWKRVLLTLEEAAAYTGIGVKKLRAMTNLTECDYVLWIGSHRMLKRRKLDEYLDASFCV